MYLSLLSSLLSAWTDLRRISCPATSSLPHLHDDTSSIAPIHPSNNTETVLIFKILIISFSLPFLLPRFARCGPCKPVCSPIITQCPRCATTRSTPRFTLRKRQWHSRYSMPPPLLSSTYY